MLPVDFTIMFIGGWYFFLIFGPLKHIFIAISPRLGQKTMCESLISVNFLHCTDQTFYIDGFDIFEGFYRNYPLFLQGRQLHMQTVNGIRCDRVHT